jgi:hypothetical protein
MQGERETVHAERVRRLERMNGIGDDALFDFDAQLSERRRPVGRQRLGGRR